MGVDGNSSCGTSIRTRPVRVSAGVADPYRKGRGGNYVKAGKALALLGAAGALAGRRNRMITAISGTTLIAASAATRWGIFHAGMASANDPKYTVILQRQRLARRAGGEVHSWHRAAQVPLTGPLAD